MMVPTYESTAREQEIIIKNQRKQINYLNNKLKNIKEYVNYLVIFNQTINGKFSETQWGQDILDLIGDEE